ncbi:MAG: hypothetical protein HYV95_07540 [Opitutae bacterium]|nr:hypothetical protein [Opitutae bacterium]
MNAAKDAEFLSDIATAAGRAKLIAEYENGRYLTKCGIWAGLSVLVLQATFAACAANPGRWVGLSVVFNAVLSVSFIVRFYYYDSLIKTLKMASARQ